MAKYIIVSGSTLTETLFYILDCKSLEIVGRAFPFKEDAEYVATTMEEENKSFDEAMSDLDRMYQDMDNQEDNQEEPDQWGCYPGDAPDRGRHRSSNWTDEDDAHEAEDPDVDSWPDNCGCEKCHILRAQQMAALVWEAVEAEAKVNPLLAQLLAPNHPFDPIPDDKSGWNEPLLV